MSCTLLPLEQRRFPDGERYLRLREDPRGEHVWIVADLMPPDETLVGVLDRLQENEYRLRTIIESEPEWRITSADQGVLQQGEQGQKGEPARHQDGHHKSASAAGAKRTIG